MDTNSVSTVFTLGEVIHDLIKAKSAANRRPSYVRHLKFSLNAFAKGRNETPISEITRSHVVEWFQEKGYTAPSTRRGNHGVLSVLFEHAIRIGQIKSNPCLQIDKVTVDRSPPRILTPAEARKMLLFAKRKMKWRLPQIILGLYAGIRPTELARLYWKDVNLDGGYCIIDAAAAKTRRRRVVRLDPKAVAWLRHCRPQNDRPIGSNCWKWKRLIERNCGLKWEQDLLRHTAASYLLARHEDAGKVARMLGNSVQVMMDFYVELVTPEDCRRFWKI